MAAVKNFINRLEESSLYTSFTNQEVIGSWALAEIPEWGVLVEMPYQEVSDELRPLIILAVASDLLFIIFIIIFLSIVFRKLLTPINKLELGGCGYQGRELGYKA